MSEPYEFMEIPALEKEVDKLISRSVRDAILQKYPGHGGFSERLRDVCKFIRAKNSTVRPRAGLLAYASGGNPSGALCINTMVKYWSKEDGEFPKDILPSSGKKKSSAQESSEFLRKLLEE